MNMTIQEYYSLCQEEEEYKHQHPCCKTCKNYYEEYGYSNCNIHGETLENEEEKCDDWK